MKSTKTWVILISSLLLLGTITYAANTKEIKVDLTNAIQHLNRVKVINKNSTWEAVLSNTNNKINIKTDNIVLWDTNSIITSNNSSILWGENNEINTWKNNTIIAWLHNKIEKSTTSNILWWERNTIKENTKNSSIIWWLNNTIYEWSNNSTIIGGSWNGISWSLSSIIWNNNNITWNNSMALWSWAKINSNNSFLRTEWSTNETVNTDDIFVVISKSWMVVNTDNANPMAQLTIWWSLSVHKNMKDENIECWGWKWHWIIKSVQKWWSETDKCFCSCNWDNWNSIFWEGECESYCKADLIPKCGNKIEIKNIAGQKKPVWSCEVWEVIEWKGSYFMKWNTIYRICQTTDWASTTCSWTPN